MVRRSAVVIAIALLATTADARAATTEVASLSGGAEQGVAGPVLAGGGQVAFGWVDGDQAAHVRVAGGGPEIDVWDAAAPPPPAAGSFWIQSVTQSIALAAGGGRLAVARSAAVASEPACRPACGVPSMLDRSYLGETLIGPVRGPLARRSGYGPGCRPGLRDVASLAASGRALAELQASTRCTDGTDLPRRRVAVVPLRGGRPVFLATSPAISATAIAGRWVAWLAGPPPNSRPDSRATLTIADRLTRRVHERLSFPVAGSEGAAGVSIALEADGRAALLLPGREVGGPCTAPSTLGWTSPRDPRLHRIATGLAVGRALALAGGRALVERGRLSPAGNCDQAGSLVAVRLSDGGARPVATFGPDETAAGNLDWDGRHAAFAAIVREGAPEDPTYRTSIRLAAMS